MIINEKQAAKVIKMKKKADQKRTVADFLRAIQVCEAAGELDEALKKIEVQLEATHAKHQQLLYFKAEIQKKQRKLKKEPGQ